MTLKVVELFAGIGAQAAALENLGIDFKSTVCEIDRYAYKSYCAIHGETENLGDICKVEMLPDCDLLTYSFPCQDLSTAGKMKGMSRDSGTRSSLLWEVGRLLADAVERERAPAVLLMENVTQVHGKKNLADWNAWLRFLDDLGYTSSWADLNAKDYGVPQSRIRCFMVSTRDGSHYQFPKGRPLDKCLKDVLESNVPESFYLSEKSIEGYQRRKADHVNRGVNFGWEPTEGEGVARCINTVPQKDCQNFLIESGTLAGAFESSGRVYDPEGVSPTVKAYSGGGNTPKIEVTGSLARKYDKDGRVHSPEGISPTIDACSYKHGGPKIEVAGEMENTKVIQARRVYSGEGVSPSVTAGGGTGSIIKIDEVPKIRYLTPRECWRLMGFSDEAYSKAAEIGTSKTQLYKQAGNSIVVNVLEAIFREIYLQRPKGQPTLEAWA